MVRLLLMEERRHLPRRTRKSRRRSRPRLRLNRRHGTLPHLRAAVLSVQTASAPRQVLHSYLGSHKAVIRSTLPISPSIPCVPFTQPRRESARSYPVVVLPAHMPTVRAHRHGSTFRAVQRQPAARSMSPISAIIASARFARGLTPLLRG